MSLDFEALGITDEETQAKITASLQSKIDETVAGLKNKNGELLGVNKTVKAELDTFKSQFDGLDIAAVKGLIEQAGQSEEARLIAEGKIDEVIAQRTERLRGDYDTKLSAAEQNAATFAEKLAKYESKVLSDSIRSAAIKAGAIPEASSDIMLRAERVFTLDDNGEVVSKVYGKDGKTPLSLAEWMDDVRSEAPYLWPTPVGAGAQGSRNLGTSQRQNLNEKAETAKKNGDVSGFLAAHLTQ